MIHYREFILDKLFMKLDLLNAMLIKKYSSDTLNEYLETEKEIDIQEMYLKHEGV